ncbi:putative kolobok1-1 nv [Trichonephila clavipes]|nr:putative kolobok1-1 nv [Trichonephila clavipes]
MPRSIESETFATYHVCHSNFQGSALKMEAVGATRIFQRSIVKRGLKYAHFYGDGDSKGFISVTDTYGKANSPTLLLTDCKTIMGLLFIAMLETYPVFRKMLLRLCFIAHQVSRNRCMGSVPSEKIVGATTKLCTKELLTKCLHGKTQNSNECLNGVIWQRVPKEVFVCLKILKSGALDAVIQFNDGYKGCVEIFKKLNITPGYFTLKAYKHLDINRINDAERHSTPNVKQRRKILRATRKKNQCFRE